MVYVSNTKYRCFGLCFGIIGIESALNEPLERIFDHKSAKSYLLKLLPAASTHVHVILTFRH